MSCEENISVGVSIITMVACCTVLAAGCHHKAESPPKSLAAVGVHTIETSTSSSTTRYSASILPASRVDVAFRVGGYIQGITKVRGVDGKLRILQEGDHVKKGATLAIVRQADYVQKLNEAKAGLGEAMAAKEQAQLDFDRANRLATNQTIAQAELDAARARLNAATARAQGALARVDEATTALADSSLRAPMDGVILTRAIEVGTLVAPGTPAFAIADLDSVKATFGVPDTVVESLQLGSPQSIFSEALRNTSFHGHISRIAPSADPKSRMFEVEVTIPNDKGLVKAGMVVMLNLSQTDETATPVALLPLSAVVRSKTGPNRFAVYVLEEHNGQSVAHLRDVELGDFLGNMIPIKAGLKTGEKVVVMGASFLSDGEAVQVIPQ